MKKQGIVSKAINATALLITFSPVISKAKSRLLDGGGDVNGFLQDIVNGYTGGVVNLSGAPGQFSTGLATEFYGAAVAGVVFKKVASFAKRHIKL
jgi:hypothetical protein